MVFGVTIHVLCEEQSMPSRSHRFTDSDRGQPIRVVGGKYKGRHGYQHKGLPETDEKLYVILNRQEGGGEEVKQIYKTSVRFGGQPELKIWEQAMLESKKVNPAYTTFLNKLLEVEFKPTPETLAIIWEDWNRAYEARQHQARSRGIIRIITELKHPTKRGQRNAPFQEAFEQGRGLYV